MYWVLFVLCLIATMVSLVAGLASATLMSAGIFIAAILSRKQPKLWRILLLASTPAIGMFVSSFIFILGPGF